MKRVFILAILVLVSFLLVSCDREKYRMEEYKTYSNKLYTIKYPSDWQEPEIIAHKVVISKEDKECSFDIHASLYKDPIEDLIPEHEEIIIGGDKGYKFKVEGNNETSTFLMIQQNDMVFEMKFICKVDDCNDCQTFINLIEKSFEFNDLESVSYANWNKYTIENLEVYYPDNSEIYNSIEEWAKERVEAFNFITEYLDIQWDYESIKMFVFNSQEHGEEYGIQLGFAIPEHRQIFELYKQTAGHELAHCISYRINNGERIDSSLIEEGLATHLNMTGLDYHVVSADILQEKNYSIKLLGDEFWKNDHAEAYACGASFVKYLIDEYGLELFKEFYSQSKYSEEESFVNFYNKEGNKLVNEWIEYLKTY